MKNLLIASFFLTLMIPSSCQNKPSEIKEAFSEEALTQNVFDLEGSESTFQEMLDTYKGKTVVMEVWASWCGDCIKGMPKVEKLQKDFPEAEFVFLSVDDKENAWKNGIKKYDIKGNHYFFNTGWDNDFTKYIELKWIPRYMVLDKEGKIVQYFSTEADDSKLIEKIKESIAQKA